MSFVPLNHSLVDSQYVGRFAPSPSGPLHLGSLVTALASYLQAKNQNGHWFIRIDDIDPPREMPGARQSILECLEAHGLHWDNTVVLQSTRSNAYEAALTTLLKRQLCYYCQCTRKLIKQTGHTYTGVCRDKSLAAPGCSLRFKNAGQHTSLIDSRLGHMVLDDAVITEDFIIKRKDGLYAYHLASVVDDIDMGITEIVRGSDLLIPTLCQLALFGAFEFAPPRVLHVPVVSNSSGLKLSKQNHAKALDVKQAKANLLLALTLLGQKPDAKLSGASVQDIIDWAIEHWALESIHHAKDVRLSSESML